MTPFIALWHYNSRVAFFCFFFSLHTTLYFCTHSMLLCIEAAIQSTRGISCCLKIETFMFWTSIFYEHFHFNCFFARCVLILSFSRTRYSSRLFYCQKSYWKKKTQTTTHGAQSSVCAQHMSDVATQTWLSIDCGNWIWNLNKMT